MMHPLDKPNRTPDWQDCHQGALVPPGTPARVAFERGLGATPGWVRPAMMLRNILVAPFGLIRGDGEANPSGTDFLARLPVVHDTPELFETGLSDRHLTFTIRVETTPGQVAVRTLIWFHSAFGRFYLRAVLPAHNAILRRIVASLAVEARP